jgi:hypothetical protein
MGDVGLLHKVSIASKKAFSLHKIAEEAQSLAKWENAAQQLTRESDKNS